MKKKGSRPTATKVNDYVKERLGRLCAKKGFTEYELLQMMCDCAVRYMDDAHNLSADMEQLMVTFEHMNGWADAFNLADPTVGREIGEAFYGTKDPSGKKHGQRCHWVYKPYFGDWQQSENVVNIFITASMDFRVENVSKVKEIDADHARKLIEQVESRRAQYYNYYTGKKWGAAESYDFCIDASILGLEETEKIIAEYIRKRFA